VKCQSMTTVLGIRSALASFASGVCVGVGVGGGASVDAWGVSGRVTTDAS
jgi:hypothetical protein